MAPIFARTSKTLDITDFSTLKTVGNTNGIDLEHITVGGYDWAIEVYLQGINEWDSHFVSICFKLLNGTKSPDRAMHSIRLWDWTTSEWDDYTTDLVTMFPTDEKDCWGYDRLVANLLTDGENYLKNDTIRIRYTFMVTPPLQAPASSLKPDVNLPPDNSNQGYPSGANISNYNGFHTASYAPPNRPSNLYTKLPRQPTVRIYCEAARDLSLTARNGNVVLAPADSNDDYQHWIKDMHSFNEAKDKDGFPIFALVNRVTGEALKNQAVENQEVSLVPYDQNRNNDSMKWTEVLSTGFRTIRITSAPTLNMTAYPKDASIFNDGTKIVVQRLADTPNQRWKTIPYNSNVPY